MDNTNDKGNIYQKEYKVKSSIYKSYDDLPLMLNAEIVKDVLGISISSAYELMRRMYDVITQIKRLGNNVNQLLILSRQGRISTVNLTETQAELKKIYGLLSSALRRR